MDFKCRQMNKFKKLKFFLIKKLIGNDIVVVNANIKNGALFINNDDKRAALISNVMLENTKQKGDLLNV